MVEIHIRGESPQRTAVLNGVDDLELVARARSGDAEAFRALIVRHQRKVYAVALGIVRDRDLAWDVAQETFVRVHAHLGEFKGESSFQTWALRIVTHLGIDAVRKERASAREALEDVRDADLARGGEGVLATALGNDPQATALRRELARHMGEALAQLPEKHRTILVLRELEGLSYEALAERLGIHKGTVMSRLFHARKKMQVLLEGYAGRAPEGAAQAGEPAPGRPRGSRGGGREPARDDVGEASGREGEIE